MKTNKTEIVNIDGKEVVVSDLLLNMAVSNPIINGVSTINVNMRLKPFAVVDGVKIETPELNDRVVLMADLLNSGDPIALQCFGKIHNAIQEYITNKNI